MNTHFEFNIQEQKNALMKLLSQNCKDEEPKQFHVANSIDDIYECANSIYKGYDDFKTLDGICDLKSTCDLGSFFGNACIEKKEECEKADVVLFTNDSVAITVNYKNQYKEPKLLANDIVLTNIYIAKHLPVFIEHEIIHEYEYEGKKFPNVHQLSIDKMYSYVYDSQWNYLDRKNVQNGSEEVLYVERLNWFDVIITYNKDSKILALNGAKICKIDEDHIYVDYYFDPIYQNHHIVVQDRKFYLFDLKMLCIYYRYFFSHDVVKSHRVDDSLFFELCHSDIDRNFILIIDIKDLEDIIDQEILYQINITTKHITQSSGEIIYFGRPEYKIKKFLHRMNMILFENWEPREISIDEKIKVENYALYDLETQKTYYFQIKIVPYMLTCSYRMYSKMIV